MSIFLFCGSFPRCFVLQISSLYKICSKFHIPDLHFTFLAFLNILNSYALWSL